MIETYKMFNSYDQDVALNLQRRDSYTRGHKYKLCMRKSNRDIGKYSFSNRIVQPWNSLNENTVCSQNLKTFEARLDSQWKTANLYYDYRASPPGAWVTSRLGLCTIGPSQSVDWAQPAGRLGPPPVDWAHLIYFGFAIYLYFLL